MKIYSGRRAADSGWGTRIRSCARDPASGCWGRSRATKFSSEAMRFGLGRRFDGDFDLFVPGGTGDIERAEDDRFAGGDFRCDVEDRLMDDGVLGADAGLLVGNAGLLDFGAKLEVVGIAGNGSDNVDPHIEVLDLSRRGVLAIGAAGDYGNAVALAEFGALTGSGDEGDVLRCGVLSVLGLHEGEGEAPGFVRAVEVGDDLLHELELGGGAADGDGGLIGDPVDSGILDIVAQNGLDLGELFAVGDVIQKEGLVAGGNLCVGAGVSVLGAGVGCGEGDGKESEGAGIAQDAVPGGRHVRPRKRDVELRTRLQLSIRSGAVSIETDAAGRGALRKCSVGLRVLLRMVKAAAANIFDWLRGEWTFVRAIPGYASVRGEARIVQENDGAARYEETARVTLLNGGTLRATQCYRFRPLAPPANGVEVLFCDSNELFERLEFHDGEGGALEARARFVCGADTYESAFLVDGEERLHVEHVVRGPRKDYRVLTVYTRKSG